MRLETLEKRELLHAGEIHTPLLPSTTPDFSLPGLDQISPLVVNSTDPHLVGDYGDLPPIDFDKLLGLPGGGTGGPEAEELPDFFPAVSGGFSLDQTTQPGRNLIRFGTQVNNQGNGPAILISGRPGIDSIPSGAPITSWVNPDGSQNVLQAIYNFSGNSYSLSRYVAAGRFTYHSGHGHFHYDGYAYYKLRHRQTNGQPGGYVTRNDGTDIIGEKVGFCLINIASSFIMENGQSSTTLPGYNDPGQPSTGCGLFQGIHVGEADVYSSSLSGQWLDVTGVPNGQYFLEMTMDGENAVLETNDANNTKTFLFTLNANPPSGGIQPDVFDSGGNNNNTFDDATDMGVMGTFAQTGLTVHWGQDFDYFRFVASSSGNYTVTATQSSGDVNIFLYDANRNLIGSSSNSSGSESISYNYVEGQTYFVKAEPYNSSTVSNYQVAWNLKPKASSSTSVAIATEAGQRGSFTIARNGPTTSPLTVVFTLTGTAINGVDYQSVPLSISLGDLQSTGEVEIIPIPDAIPEGQETVILRITSNNAYVVGATGTQLLITDLLGDFNNDGALNVLDIDLLTQNIGVGPANPALFDVTNDGQVTAADLDRWLQLAGTLNLPSGNAYLRGDSNLDGNVDGTDFNAWNANKFTATPFWSAGDFNADGNVDGGDFGLWNANKFLSAGRPVPNLYDAARTGQELKRETSLADARRKAAVDRIFRSKSELAPWVERS